MKLSCERGSGKNLKANGKGGWSFVLTYSSRYARITVLSLRARGGVYVCNLSPGTRPLGETSRRSAGFLYGSTSSARRVSRKGKCQEGVRG